MCLNARTLSGWETCATRLPQNHYVASSMVSERLQECICRPSSKKHPQGNQQGEKTEGVCVSIATVSADCLWFAHALGQQFCLCGLCDAGRQEGRHHDVRVTFRRTPPLNQGWCVCIFSFLCVMCDFVNSRAQATALKVDPLSPECHSIARQGLE
jgi:hypothetical protein